MKKMIFALMVCMVLLCFAPVLADEKPAPGMSALLADGGYYGIGSSIPEGSYTLTCVSDEEESWYSSCDVILTTYDFLQISEEAGIHLYFPEGENGYEPIRVFLQEGMVLRVRYSDVIITAAAAPEAGTEDILEGNAYYGIGYDIQEGEYYLNCTGEIMDTFCTVTVLTYTNYLSTDMGYRIHLDNYAEDGSLIPTRLFLKAGTILEVGEIPIRITPAEPLEFK